MGGAVATRSWPALAGFAIVVAHLPQFLHRLLDGDEAIYGSIAVLMNLGGGLYGYGGGGDKPPGVFLVFALPVPVLGACQTRAGPPGAVLRTARAAAPDLLHTGG